MNLSEALQHVPGLVVQNRQNYAQDVQVSSCGFGSHSTFGVRGIRLMAKIPCPYAGRRAMPYVDARFGKRFNYCQDA